VRAQVEAGADAVQFFDTWAGVLSVDSWTRLVRPHLVPYYRDIYDSLSYIAETAQSYTDALMGILQAYLNMSSNRTGEVVKLLTLITVITTPLMMIGTWYGMNFHDMPELSWKHGYWVAAAVMTVSSIATIWYFKKKNWW